MKDQAERLRQIVKDMRKQRAEAEKRTAKVVAITSGKGGVGKTSFTVNLAICLSNMGYRVVIIDGDIGLSNVDIMLGITPKYDLSYFINNQKDFNEIAVEGPCGIRFISGGSGLRELTDLSGWRIDQLLSRVKKLDEEADIILIDTGAGVSDSVMKMILAADETILIVTPEPTSIMDAYALVKLASLQNENIRLRLVVNKAENFFEAKQILEKFSNAAKRFLNVELDKLGYICNDAHVTRSVKQQIPYTICYPKSNASKQVQSIACRFNKLSDEDFTQKGGGLTTYIQRLVNIFK